MQDIRQHYGRQSATHSEHNNLPPVSGFGRDVADNYQYLGSHEHGTVRIEIYSQHRQSFRWRDFNWQFLAFWTAYAALIFGIGYALI